MKIIISWDTVQPNIQTKTLNTTKYYPKLSTQTAVGLRLSNCPALINAIKISQLGSLFFRMKTFVPSATRAY